MKDNGITIRDRNLSVSAWSNPDLIGIEIKSVLKKDGKVLSHCLERGDFTQIKFGLRKQTALNLYEALRHAIQKDIELYPEQWEVKND